MNSPEVKCQLIIRKSPHEVFEAFADPKHTTHFWFTHSSGRIEEGKSIEWRWEMYDLTIPVKVISVEKDHLIRIQWGSPVATVDFIMNNHEKGTGLTIREYGYSQTGDELQEKLLDSKGGFTHVIDGLKAYLEHDIALRLIEDKLPDS